MSAAISSIAMLTCAGTASAFVSAAYVWYFLVTAVPCSFGSSWRTPNTYRKAGVERGTATSSSTRPGTTSQDKAGNAQSEIDSCTRVH